MNPDWESKATYRTAAMVTLPSEVGVDVTKLGAAFNNVTNSYKFLWFLSILEEIESGSDRSISVATLLGNMVAIAWYPINYFRLNFGKQDVLARLVIQLLDAEKAPIHARSHQVSKVATREIRTDTTIGRDLGSLGAYVPYRFIRPFFAEALRGAVDAQVNRKVIELAAIEFDRSESPPLYRFHNGDREIELHPGWYGYLSRHLSILRGFTLWHLLNYLQQRNPGVPNLATKLFEPRSRNLSIARRFWGIVFDCQGPITCIYSGQQMVGDDYSLDHFLPWRFVAHDSLWNLVPTPQNVNSSKGDRIPDFTAYFDQLAQIQFLAVRIVASTKRPARLLDDYLYLLNFDSTDAFNSITIEQFSSILRNTMAPQVQIAQNMGFQGEWQYRPQKVT